MKYFKIFIITIFQLNSYTSYAQIYTDYVGAGHDDDIAVTSSDQTSTNTSSSISGNGLGIAVYEAARFLNHASLGADYETIDLVAHQGISVWLDDQFAMPVKVNFVDTTWQIWEHFYP